MSTPRSHANPNPNPRLSDIFGQGHSAYFSNGPVTRLSSIRLNKQLLDKASTHPSARYLTFEELNPLRDPQGKLAFVSYDDVANGMGRPYAHDEKAQIAAFDPDEHHPNVIFLGMCLEAGGNCRREGPTGRVHRRAVLCAGRDVVGALRRVQAAVAAAIHDTHAPTRIDLTLDHARAAIYSHARALLDWNTRNRYCSSCGGRTLSTLGGAKVVCPPADCGVGRTLPPC
ncbi:hypothetical protein A1O7_03115 [Cladophialophora yegresii CBS 114405]|uniref:Uncharacterized protein n=1 Tax=Cladophialophora yegresii CBS 114405 TaxID=1182544 RepID=W9W3P4_9EURO|nr:uncharacterized protein A1O7_03115 [Cladophialophora yegresii CBS 114405]EXJ62677.1 hypothetical protein A1O7_03115 [Cladophialophora yegresii CBS 114405]